MVIAALMVPAFAIIFNQNGMQVAGVKNGVAHLRNIAIATGCDTEVEVNAGVKDGDQVILQPPVNLTDGDRCRSSRNLRRRNRIQGNEPERDRQAHAATE